MDKKKPKEAPNAMPYVWGIPRPPDPVSTSTDATATIEPQRGGADASDFNETYANADVYRQRQLLDAVRSETWQRAYDQALTDHTAKTSDEQRRARSLVARAKTNNSIGHREMALGVAEGAVAAVVAIVATYGLYRIGKAVVAKAASSTTKGQ